MAAPSDSELCFLPVTELSRLLHARQISSVELASAFLQRIANYNDTLHAYITVAGDDALAAARAADSELARGEYRGPLHGVPVAIKDQMDVAGLRTTLGSSIVDYVAKEDSTPAARLRSAGAVILGKLNLSEFALGGNITHPFGVPRNPWDLERQAGQSSSGSGVAVAASLCAAALGGDTAGSIRSPASWCGIVGLRPTWGRVSRHGVFPMAWFMDTVGPMTKTVEDCAAVLHAIAGPDERDRYTANLPPPAFQPKDSQPVDGLNGLKGKRIGLVRESIGQGMANPEVESIVQQALHVMENAGAQVQEVSIPLFPHGGLISNTIADAEASFVHREYLHHHSAQYDFASRRRLLAANLITAPIYQKALRFRVLMRRQVMAALELADVLVTPTQADPAPKIATSTGLDSKEAVMRQFFGLRAHRGPFNLAGVPAMSMPCGFTQGGLPVGLQIAGKPFDELAVFQAGHAYQQATDWHTKRPPLA